MARILSDTAAAIGTAVAMAPILLTYGPVAGVATASSVPRSADVQAIVPPTNFWLATPAGNVLAFGDACNCRSAGSHGPLNQPIVGITPTVTTSGYWEVASDGGIFTFGDAHFYGSMGGTLARPVVGMASTSDGLGYWEVASDGGIFTFGDAHFYGSLGGTPTGEPAEAMVSSQTGHGYWVFTARVGNARSWDERGGYLAVPGRRAR